MPPRAAGLALALVFALAPSCSRFGPLYPSRPAPTEGAPVADPEPSRVVVHLAATADGLRQALEAAIPKTGEGTVPLLGGERRYGWERGALELSFGQGRIELRTRVQATLALPLKTLELPLDLRVVAEPVVSGQYVVKLQAVEVKVTSPASTMALADRVAGVYGRIEAPIADELRRFSRDLRPLLAEAAGRIAAPLPLSVGDASACARLRVLEIEAGPTVLADGIEKDLALVVAPSVTMPCPVVNDPGRPELPPLSNVAALPSGPFTVTIPIAARYEELTRAMGLAFTDGKLFFSPEYPGLYLERPELYESSGQLVLKLHLAGPVSGLGVEADLDGDLYLAGHPAVVDNELSVPDLEPTIETRNLLLSLKAIKDGDAIRAQARKALRLDLGARVRAVEARLGDQLTFGDAAGCFSASVDRVAVTAVYAHAAYLRAYVAVTGRARLDVPCREVPPASGGASPGDRSTERSSMTRQGRQE